MADPIEIHRKEVSQRIQVANSLGGWEGEHTDFKRELGSTPRDLAKLLKHILAFANTPRRTDAYIVFGVSEDKDRRLFEHVGVSGQGFPARDRIEALVHEYTKLRDVVVDDGHLLDGKRTPYVMIPLQDDGPYVLLRSFSGGAEAVDANVIYRRYGSSTRRAAERDAHRMRADWAGWFLNSRYERNAASLMDALAKRFPDNSMLEDAGDYVRLLFESEISDSLGTHTATELVHAYSGFEPVEPSAVEKIVRDQAHPALQRSIIGARFSPATRVTAKASMVRCIPLDEIYFVNDPYAKYCREFLHKWADECSGQLQSEILDLDFRRSDSPNRHDRRTSILSFLEEQLRSTAREAVIVHGAFGCGKTTTAKQLVANLADDYLRGQADLPKALYVDVRDMDIRSRRGECIESQLRKYRLSREQIDSLVAQVEQDEITLVFDGVDEMARPFTSEGRQQAMEILREVGNRRAAAYFVRSPYFPQPSQMLESFGRLADTDFLKGRKRIAAAEILGFTEEQVARYLESRLSLEDARTVRSTLNKIGLGSFLADPLIMFLVTEVIEREGIDAINSFPIKGLRALFLSQLVNRLLKREEEKRKRHSGLAEDFPLFQQVLRKVAFRMICTGSLWLTQDQLDKFVGDPAYSAVGENEAVDSFRTMSWIHRGEDGALTFRHDALTLVCAAQHANEAFRNRDILAIADWRQGARLGELVCEYAGQMITGEGLLGATELLGCDIQFNVKQLIYAVLAAAKDRADFEEVSTDLLDQRRIGAIVRGTVNTPALGRPCARVLLRSLGEKRAVEVGVPMLWCLARIESPEAVDLALEVLQYASWGQGDFCDELRAIKQETSSWVDVLLLRDLGISIHDLVDCTSYENLFKRIESMPSLDRKKQVYADKTMRGIEGEKQHRAADQGKEYRGKRRHRS